MLRKRRRPSNGLPTKRVRFVPASVGPAIPAPVRADQDHHIAMAEEKQTANKDCPDDCESDVGDDSDATVDADGLISAHACGGVPSDSDLVLDSNTIIGFASDVKIKVRLDENKSTDTSTCNLLVCWPSSGDAETSTPQQYKVECSVYYNCPELWVTPKRCARQVRFMVSRAQMQPELSVAFFDCVEDAVDMPKV